MIQIDMEMPKNCKFCPLHDVNPDQCPIRTIYKDDYATSRFTDCPLYKIAKDTDTISRKAAIDAHYEYCNKHPDAGFPVWSLKILEDLPPAQPDLSGYSDKLWKAAYERGKAEALAEIVRCKDCKHRDPEDHKCDCGHDIIWQLPRDDKWYCADAERRTDDCV